MQYVAGLSHLKQFPPDRFEWICNEGSVSIECTTSALALWRNGHTGPSASRSAARLGHRALAGPTAE
jgi:hypothetical protein